jgi:hypothetical protein
MIQILSIILLNLIVYFPTIWLGDVMDDHQGRDKHRNQKGYRNWKTILYGAGTFFDTRLDHAFTLVLWINFNILAYFALGANDVAFAAAMLISVHPLNNQLSIWLNGRRYLIAAILLMGTIICFNHHIYTLALGLYLLTGLFQITVILAPIIFLIKYPWAILALAALVALVWKKIVEKYTIRIEAIPCVDLKKWQPRRPIVIVKLFGFYVGKMLNPSRVQTVYSFLQMFGRTKEGNDDAYKINGDFYKGICVAIGIGALFFLCPMVMWPYIVFMVLALVQWCAIVPVLQLVADRYAAISNIFMSFFIAYLAIHYLPYAPLFLAGLVGYYACSTIKLFPMYKDMNAWYDYHINDDVGNLAVVNLKVGLLLAERRIWQVQALLEKALWKNPNDYALNFCGYIVNMIIGAIPLAKNHLEVCKKNIYLGEESVRQGELSDAELAINAMSGQKVIIPEHMKKGKK